MSPDKKFLNVLKKSESRDKRFALLCAAIGVIAGLLAVLFRVSIVCIFNAAWSLGGALGEANRYWLMPLIPALGGAITGLCIAAFAQSASGSGIPQTKAAYYNNFGIFKWRDVIYRFALGSIFCGFGNSAGREGPTVHLSAAAASALAQNLGFSKRQVQSSVPAGMGAGIAASFNAPLSAISFVFEELLGGFDGKGKTSGVIIAVVIAAVIARLILGENPVLPVGMTDFRTSWQMLAFIPIAILSGFTGEAFLELLLKLRKTVREKLRLPLWFLAGSGGLIVGVVAISAYGLTGFDSVFSVGYGILIPAFGGQVGFFALTAIFAGKFFATIVNYSMGGSGGLFSPSLVIGGTLGGAVGAAMCGIFGFDNSLIGVCVLLGMGSCFASIIRCPVTSIVMIFELTLNYSLILPLIAANLISYAIARAMHPEGLYDSLLRQDGISLRKMPSAAAELSDMPVSAIMAFNPVCVSPRDTPSAALAKLKELGKSYKAYPAVSEDGKFVGIITRKQLEAARESPEQCSELILRKPEYYRIFTDSPVSAAAKFFVENDCCEVAVVARSKPDAAVGMLTLHDLARLAYGLRG